MLCHTWSQVCISISMLCCAAKLLLLLLLLLLGVLNA